MEGCMADVLQMYGKRLNMDWQCMDVCMTDVWAARELGLSMYGGMYGRCMGGT